MKKIICVIMSICLFFSSSSYAIVYNLHDVSFAKIITAYDKETIIDNIDTVVFGSYWQNTSDIKEPIEWIVLDRQAEKVLLLSKYILDAYYYDKEQETNWENSTIRNWLQETFYNEAFDDTEKMFIFPTLNDNVNSEYNISGGNVTNDLVFLLSADEIKNYFKQQNMRIDNKRLATRGTNYSKSINHVGLRKMYVSQFVGWAKGNSNFWLRTPGRYTLHAAFVDRNGILDEEGGKALLVNGIRPAIWVSTNLLK